MHKYNRWEFATVQRTGSHNQETTGRHINEKLGGGEKTECKQRTHATIRAEVLQHALMAFVTM